MTVSYAIAYARKFCRHNSKSKHGMRKALTGFMATFVKVPTLHTVSRAVGLAEGRLSIRCLERRKVTGSTLDDFLYFPFPYKIKTLLYLYI